LIELQTLQRDNKQDYLEDYVGPCLSTCSLPEISLLKHPPLGKNSSFRSLISCYGVHIYLSIGSFQLRN
jgi:hypothetical protein